VPFINFRMAGVFAVIGLSSYAIAKVERWGLKHVTPPRLALLGVLAMAIPHWYWYGEKIIMNEVMIWAGLSVLYRVRVGLREPAGEPGRMDVASAAAPAPAR
jgi:hypothetical protein